MIRSFTCKDTQSIWAGSRSRNIPINIQEVARRKLRMLHNAASMRDLLVPPGNRLEALKGNRKGQYSIRINDQWRICFEWNDGAENVEIVDYH